MTSKLIPDRIGDVDVLDAWKIRRDMELEERAAQKKKNPPRQRWNESAISPIIPQVGRGREV